MEVLHRMGRRPRGKSVQSVTDLSQDIEVVMAFLRTEDGGKTRLAFSGYRPQFHYQGEDWDAQHTYVNVKQVNPGDAVTAQLKFLSPQFHAGKIAVGTEFEIREGKAHGGDGPRD